MDYHGERWKLLRKRVLLRDHMHCRDAARYSPIPVDATTVHHVYPAEDYPGWAWCDWNLISLSDKAHNAMHDRKTGKLTERGLAWQRRTSPPPNAPNPFD